MNINFSVEEAVKKRYSVRNYAPQAIEADKNREIELFVDSLDNPFGKEVTFHYLDNRGLADQQKLGTYGVIKGAKRYIGTSIKVEPMALEALGYELETAMLYLAHLGLGTCWLGGTFNRKGFAKAMDIGEDALFPAVTPYGYAAPKMHMTETLMRKMIRADQRKPWEQLFFSEDFRTPLTKEAAGDLAFPLDMLRLGPSASNKQPWRVLLKGNTCHFYEYKEPGYSDAFPYDIQRIDMGIAAAHFDHSAKEKGIRGHFDTAAEPALTLPDHMEYAYSWIRE
jgi:nitroreductase